VVEMDDCLLRRRHGGTGRSTFKVKKPFDPVRDCFLRRVLKLTHDFAVYGFPNTRTSSEIGHPKVPNKENPISELLLYLPVVVHSPSKMTYVPHRIYG
jgi:hypothetical protein